MIRENAITKYRLVMLSIVLLLCTYSHKAGAQDFINRTYLEGRPTVLFSSLVCYDSNYYVTGVTLQQNDPQNYYRLFVGKIDMQGNMVKSLGLYDSIPKYFASFHNTALVNDAGEIVYAGYSGDSIYKVLFGAMDTSLSNTSIKEYYTPDSYAFDAMDIIQYDSNTYFITGLRTIQSTNNPNVLLIKVDGTGERVWQRLYGGTLNEYAKSIIALKNGNLMIGAFKYDMNQTNEISNTWLIEVDTGGNIVRQWLDTDDSTYAAEGLIQTQDGGFVYGAQRKGRQSFGAVDIFSPSIVKLDSSFDKQWVYRYDDISLYSGIFDIEELPDGRIIACGNRRGKQADFLNGWIVKLSANGEVLWDRIYQGLNVHQAGNFLSDIDVLPDGSLIAVGQCQQPNAPRQVGWLLKVDSNGCEIENCTVGIEDIEQNQPLKVYPNPATDRLTIEVPEHSISGKVYITSITGESIEELAVPKGATDVELNTASYPAGVYMARLDTAMQKFIIVR